MRYPIVIHGDQGSGYGVIVPDLPGCFSAGNTLDEAIDMAHEAIICHLEGLLIDCQPIPERAPIETHVANDEYKGAIWAVVKVDPSKVTLDNVEFSIEMHPGLLAHIDDLAAREGESRSGLLTRLALDHIGRLLVA